MDRSWNGAESPQPPLPAGESYPSGPVVTITFTNGSNPVLALGRLTDAQGEEVPCQVQHPGNDSWLKSTWSLYAYSPLKAQSTYTVTFKGTVSGEPFVDAWEFTTE